MGIRIRSIRRGETLLLFVFEGFFTKRRTIRFNALSKIFQPGKITSWKFVSGQQRAQPCIQRFLTDGVRISHFNKGNGNEAIFPVAFLATIRHFAQSLISPDEFSPCINV